MSKCKIRTGVLIAVHGDYGRSLLDAAEALVGPLEATVIVVCSEADPAALRRAILAAVERADQGAGVLVLADLCGSTPANVCFQVIAEREDCDVVTGLNLAMLLKLATCDRADPAPDLARALHESTVRSTVVGSSFQRNGGTCGR